MPNEAEADTWRRFVVPGLQAAGWDIRTHSIADQRTLTNRHAIALNSPTDRRKPSFDIPSPGKFSSIDQHRNTSNELVLWILKAS